ncbi:TPA: hypothetical protein ACR6SO_005524, partial [Klebsiella pneumoniae]
LLSLLICSKLTSGDRDMSLDGFSRDKVEWFRSWVLKKNFLEVVDLHFQLSEAVKKHYRLRADQKHLSIAISACEYMICISDIAMDALIAKALYQIYEYEQVVGDYPYPKTFYRPSHHGYYQLGVLLRKCKNIKREEQLNRKMHEEGWGGGEIELSQLTGSKLMGFKIG